MNIDSMNGIVVDIGESLDVLSAIISYKSFKGHNVLSCNAIKLFFKLLDRF